MFGFCGSNGAGKTTTMRIAMGLVRADAGEVRWQGRVLDQETRRSIGYMPEERGLYPKMKVGEQVTYFARLHGLDAAAAARASGGGTGRLGRGGGGGDPVGKRARGNRRGGPAGWGWGRGGETRSRSCRWATSRGSSSPPRW